MLFHKIEIVGWKIASSNFRAQIYADIYANICNEGQPLNCALVRNDNRKMLQCPPYSLRHLPFQRSHRNWIHLSAPIWEEERFWCTYPYSRIGCTDPCSAVAVQHRLGPPSVTADFWLQSWLFQAVQFFFFFWLIVQNNLFIAWP